MQTAVLTHAGLVRQKNEDGYLLLPEVQFFAVADGMGGHQAGAFASNLALKIISEKLSLLGEEADHLSFLTQIVQEANERIHHLGTTEKDKKGMGTTFTSLWINEGVAYLAHVGDSRAYLIRDKKITLLTDDHSLVGELIRNGNLTIDEAQSHPQKHILTRALGAEKNLNIDSKKILIAAEDIFFLCTDGLTNLVTDEEINNKLNSNMKLQNSLDGLLELAFQRGAQDNITMLAISMK